jgi:hypothetical protein
VRRKRPSWRQVFAAESDPFSVFFSLVAMGGTNAFLSMLFDAVFPRSVPVWIDECLLLLLPLPVGMLAYYGLVLLRGDEIKGLEDVRTERKVPRLRELFTGTCDGLSLALGLWVTLLALFALEWLFLKPLERSLPHMIVTMILLTPSLLVGTLAYIPAARWRRRAGQRQDDQTDAVPE